MITIVLSAEAYFSLSGAVINDTGVLVICVVLVTKNLKIMQKKPHVKMFDIKTLNKPIITAETPDTPSIINVVLPNLAPRTPFPLDQLRLEQYIRLKSLPTDLGRLISNILEAERVSDWVSNTIPGLAKAKFNYHLNGISELQWEMADKSVFGLIFNNHSVRLVENEHEDKDIVMAPTDNISWRFRGPYHKTTHGDFKSVDEALDFIKKSFV